MRVLLVAGTWGYDDAWVRPGSPFTTALVSAGHTLAAPVDDGFAWTSRLEGLIGDNREWREWGRALSWWLAAHPVDAIIAHSHGGQPVATALSMLPEAWTDRRVSLVTVATPVRPELREVYRAARLRVERWRHIRSDQTDAWQRWGSLPWQDILRPWRWEFERDFESADGNVFVPGVGHSGLLSPELWTARDWWAWLTPPLRTLTPPTAPTPITALLPPDPAGPVAAPEKGRP